MDYILARLDKLTETIKQQELNIGDLFAKNLRMSANLTDTINSQILSERITKLEIQVEALIESHIPDDVTTRMKKAESKIEAFINGLSPSVLIDHKVTQEKHKEQIDKLTLDMLKTKSVIEYVQKKHYDLEGTVQDLKKLSGSVENLSNKVERLEPKSGSDCNNEDCVLRVHRLK